MTTPKPIVIAASTFLSAFPTRMCDFLAQKITRHRMQLRAITDSPNAQDVTLRLILTRTELDALIAISVRPTQRVIDAYRAACIPIVLIDEETPGVSTVTTDNFRGGELAGQYLVSTGRRRIAVVAGKMNVAGGYNAVQRVSGIRKALTDSGLFLDSDHLIEVLQYSIADGVDAMQQLAGKSVDAVFCAAGDICASGMMRKARDLGVKIPADMAIVGYDDLPMAQMVIPNLTTIRQPLSELASAAFRLAITDRDTTLQEPQKIVCMPHLVIRESA